MFCSILFPETMWHPWICCLSLTWRQQSSSGELLCVEHHGSSQHFSRFAAAHIGEMRCWRWCHQPFGWPIWHQQLLFDVLNHHTIPLNSFWIQIISSLCCRVFMMCHTWVKSLEVTVRQWIGGEDIGKPCATMHLDNMTTCMFLLLAAYHLPSCPSRFLALEFISCYGFFCNYKAHIKST